jgi:hypothetical protein
MRPNCSHNSQLFPSGPNCSRDSGLEQQYNPNSLINPKRAWVFVFSLAGFWLSLVSVSKSRISFEILQR